jgi:hypothetical protein
LAADEPVRPAIVPATQAYQAMKSMGMWLLYPPDVHGWDNGKAWITSQTMVSRIAWADKLFGKQASDPGPLRYTAFYLLRGAPTPEGAVHSLLSLFDASLSAPHRDLLVRAAKEASGGTITEGNANVTAHAVSQLLFASPEFQMA